MEATTLNSIDVVVVFTEDDTSLDGMKIHYFYDNKISMEEIKENLEGLTIVHIVR